MRFFRIETAASLEKGHHCECRYHRTRYGAYQDALRVIRENQSDLVLMCRVVASKPKGDPASTLFLLKSGELQPDHAELLAAFRPGRGTRHPVVLSALDIERLSTPRPRC